MEKLKSKGIEAFGLECHVSMADHRKRLMESTVEVRKPIKSLLLLSSLSRAQMRLSRVSEKFRSRMISSFH